jgi:hypothetical protein
MPTFVTPTVADRARDQRVLGVVRFWPPHDRGKNVWKKTDGAYTETQPASADIDTVYLGAHTYTVTTAEGNALTAAGYTVV